MPDTTRKRADAFLKVAPWGCTISVAPLIFLTALERTTGQPVTLWQIGLCLVFLGILLLFFTQRWYYRQQRLKRLRSITSPQNVRIETPGGRVVRCGVLRDPESDRDGREAWLVVPLENYRVHPGDDICSDGWPLNAVIHVPMAGGREGLYDRRRHN